MIKRDSEKLSLYPPKFGGTSLTMESGTHISGASPTFVPKNSGGATPTML